MRYIGAMRARLRCFLHVFILCALSSGCEVQVSYSPVFPDDGRRIEVFVYENQKDPDLIPSSEALAHLYQLTDRPDEWLKNRDRIARITYSINPSIYNRDRVVAFFDAIQRNSELNVQEMVSLDGVNCQQALPEGVCAQLHYEIVLSEYWASGALEQGIEELIDLDKDHLQEVLQKSNATKCFSFDRIDDVGDDVTNEQRAHRYMIVVDKALAEGQPGSHSAPGDGLVQLKCIGRSIFKGLGLDEIASRYPSITSDPQTDPHTANYRKHDLAVFSSELSEDDVR